MVSPDRLSSSVAGSGRFLQGLVIDALAARHLQPAPGDSGRECRSQGCRYRRSNSWIGGRQRPSRRSVASETTKAIKQQRSHLPSSPFELGQKAAALPCWSRPKTASQQLFGSWTVLVAVRVLNHDRSAAGSAAGAGPLCRACDRVRGSGGGGSGCGSEPFLARPPCHRLMPAAPPSRPWPHPRRPQPAPVSATIERAEIGSALQATGRQQAVGMLGLARVGPPPGPDLGESLRALQAGARGRAGTGAALPRSICWRGGLPVFSEPRLGCR